MSKDNILTIVVFALVIGFAALLSSVRRRATWQSKRQASDDVAYRMTLRHQQVLLRRIYRRGEQQTRLIYNTDFYDYFQTALGENPTITEREVCVLYYLQELQKEDDSLSRNSGNLEEEA